MKTQKSHLERQMQHSHDLAMARLNEKNKQFETVGKWVWVIVTTVWVLMITVSYLLR